MSSVMEDWCDQFSMCYKCKFRNKQCIAPDSKVLFPQWQEEMLELILKEVATEQLL